MKFRFLTLILLLCLVGNMAQAQTSPTVTYVADNLDFNGYHTTWAAQNPSTINWAEGSNYLRSFSQNGQGTRYFTSQANTLYNNEYRLSVDSRDNLQIALNGGNDGDPSMLQFAPGSISNVGLKTRLFYIHHLGVNDKVTIALGYNTRCYIICLNKMLCSS